MHFYDLYNVFVSDIILERLTKKSPCIDKFILRLIKVLGSENNTSCHFPIIYVK